MCVRNDRKIRRTKSDSDLVLDVILSVVRVEKVRVQGELKIRPMRLFHVPWHIERAIRPEGSIPGETTCMTHVELCRRRNIRLCMTMF